jgi:hypothetical protein
MEFFNRMFPNISLWNVNIRAGNILPEGLYAFLELYCGNPKCDCNAGTFDMVEIDSNGKILGERISSIYYEWNNPESDENPNVVGIKTHSKLTKAALEIFKNSMREYNYRNNIKEHYQMVKDYFRDNPTHWVSESDNNEKLGRNDFCSCGSGKKYKKCCLYK